MLFSNKMTRRGNSKADEYSAKYQDEFRSSSVTFAKILKSENPTDYYNANSNILAIRHGDNTYWTYLTGDGGQFPNPDIHDVLWLRLKKVDGIPENKNIPDTVPADMPISISFLIPRLDRPASLDGAGLGTLTSNYLRDDREYQRIYHGRRSEDAGERTGLAFNEKSGSVLLKGPGPEIAIDEGGVHITGTVNNHDMDSKGIFAQNPLSFLIPETIVTFPISMKFLPDLQKISNIGQMLSNLDLVRSTIGTLSKL
ncbi:hypothetical protein [Acinetobacter sp.]|uniref:hypothetical protein n=1 Tax=Acinetobacter sp. TaxID=472 RepID=UPI003D08B6F7